MEIDSSIFDDPNQLIGNQMLDCYSKEDYIKLPFAIGVYKEYYSFPDGDLDWDTYLVLLAFAPLIITRLIYQFSPRTIDEQRVLKAFCHKYNGIAKWINCLKVNIDKTQQDSLKNTQDNSFKAIAQESIAFFNLCQQLYQEKQIDQGIPPVELSWHREFQSCALCIQDSGLVRGETKPKVSKVDYYNRQIELANLLDKPNHSQVTPHSTANFEMDTEAYVLTKARIFLEQQKLIRNHNFQNIYQKYIAARKRIGNNFRTDKNLQQLQLIDCELQPTGRNSKRTPRQTG